MAEEVNTGIQFEDILPWGSEGGDTGLSSRLKLKRNFEKIKMLLDSTGAMFLSKTHEDATVYLISFFGGIIADLMVQSPDFRMGTWTTDEETGEDHNDGTGFSIWKNVVDAWNMEIDYATVRHLLRAKELYTQTAHIGEVTNQTIFKVGLQTLGNILIGKYAEGVEGGIITPEGHVEIETLITRGLAKLQDLFVVNDSTFGGSLSSIDFISDFLGGKGWSIQKKTRVNAAGVEEEYYALEIDNVTVRNTLRVYEMVVSQLRGEFDNYVFAAMMEVHHYDPNTGKVWLVPQRNQRAVAFKQGDYIKVQQYVPGNDVVSGGNGYITKGYELIVTEVGTGGLYDENGERLDWVTFKNFVSDIEGGTPATVIAEKDTFVRVDNETDDERKGLMQIITVGPNTPYQDVYYGMKTNPNDALKVRMGNLSGLRTDLFGWLEAYGAYLPNLYAVGKMFNRQTGESFNSSLEVTRERLRSVYTETTYNISDEDNFLTNGFFARDLEAWEECAVGGGAAPSDLSQQVINSGDGTPLMVNGAVLAYQNRLTAEVTEYAGMKVLHLLGMGVYQNFSDITANGTHKENVSDNDQSDGYTQTKDVEDGLYMGVRMIALSAGTLKVSFVQSNGSVIAEWSETLNASREWQLVQAKDSDAQPWAYTGKQGRMIVSYTGECYIRFVALRTDPIANSRETYETLFEQTARRITLQAAKQTADLNTAVAEIEIEFDHVRQTVTNNKDAADRAFNTLKTSLDAEIADREDLENTFYGTWIYQNDHLLSLMAAQFNADGTIKGYSDLKIQVGQISTTVTNNKTAADAAFKTLTDDLNDEISDRQSLENAYHATWVYQNDHLLSLMAAQFNADGTIKGYSDLQIKADNITQSVNQMQDSIEMLDEAWEQGGYSNAAGKDLGDIKKSATNVIRYTRLVPVTSDTAVYINDGYEVDCYFFGSDKKSLGRTGSYSHEDDDIGKPLGITVPSGAVYAAFTIEKDSGTTTFRDSGFLVINKQVVTRAYLSLYVDKDDVSWLTGSADNIVFNFSKKWEVQRGGNRVMWLDSSNDLNIVGHLKQGTSIDYDVPIGTVDDTPHMRIYADRRQGLIGKCSGIEGIDASGNQVSDFGFRYIDNKAVPYMILSRGSYETEIMASEFYIREEFDSSWTEFSMFMALGKLYITAPLSSWRLEDETDIAGQVYRDGSGYLKVRLTDKKS